MRIREIFFLLSIVFVLNACGVPMGNRIDVKNLKVYYLEGITKEEAVDFTKYWRDNGFIGEQQQVIQLDVDENEFILVKIIEKEIYYDSDLSISEEIMLQEIERNLNEFVFSRPAYIQVVDNTFRPLEKISTSN